MYEEPLTFESFIQLRRTNPDLYHTLEVHRWMTASMEQLGSSFFASFSGTEEAYWTLLNLSNPPRLALPATILCLTSRSARQWHYFAL